MKILFFALIIVAQIDYSDAMAEYKETILEARGPLGPLKGAYVTNAEQNAPTVIMIPGSGPTDRDGNNPYGIRAFTYKYLAEDLAKNGIHSVRIDKRGLYLSASAVQNANDVTLHKYVEDIHSWINRLRILPHISCVWLLGHSEGGLVALLSAQELSDICGIVLVSTPGQPFGDILRRQLKDNPANAAILPQALEAIAQLENGNTVSVDDFHPALQKLFYPDVQNYLIDLMSYDPATLISKVSRPILILQGDKDLQTKPEDARILSQANSKAHLKMLQNTNHVLKTVTTNNQLENLETYGISTLPLVPGIAGYISDFIKGKNTTRFVE
ncbi:MAG: alpha/beta fold hydrolase [Sneathiella sp.]